MVIMNLFTVNIHINRKTEKQKLFPSKRQLKRGSLITAHTVQTTAMLHSVNYTDKLGQAVLHLVIRRP